MTDSESIVFHLVVFSGIVVMYIWLRVFTLEVESERVRYSTLFGGTKSIALAEIAKVEWKVFDYKDGQVLQPPIRIEITPKPSSKAQRLIINAKMFDRKGLAEFVQLIEGHIQRGCRG